MPSEIKILVLSDRIASLEAIQNSLNKLGATGLTSLYQPQMFQALGQSRFDLLVLDFDQIPEGLKEGVHYLKEDLHSQDMPLVIITGEQGQLDHFLNEFGANNLDFVLKPVPEDYLIGKLDFWIRYLMQRKEVFAQTAPAHPQVRPGSVSADILLVEDDEVNQQLTQLLLEQINLHADVAATGLEALDAIKNKEYGLILMDIELPDLNGIECTRRIRQDEALHHKPAVPIVALTGNEAERDRQQCLKAGMNDHIAKPLNGHDLEIVVKKYLLKNLPQLAQVGEGHMFGDPSATSLLDYLSRELRPALWSLVQTFIDKLPRNLERLEQALSSSDGDGLKQAANHLRGSCSSFWAVAMTVLNQELNPLLDMIMDLETLETLGREDNLKAAREVLDRVNQETDSLLKLLQSQITSPVA